MLATLSFWPTLLAVFKYLMSCCAEDGVHLFSIAQGCRTRIKLQANNFQQNNRKTSLTVQVAHLLSRLPPEVVGSQLLKVFKHRLDCHLSGML